MIKIENISKSFGDFVVLKNVNLEISKGETLVILGKSGTGKSVLLRIIIGLLEPDEGSIFINNYNITKINTKQLNQIRKKIGFLFQNSALYDSLSVRENLEFALRDRKDLSYKDITERVEKYLDAVKLIEAIDKMPSELSGGMRKRVALARALIIEPEIILYDEPTTGLDPITTREISYLISEVQKKFNLTSVVVTHDLECVKIVADKIAVLHNGEIKFYGDYSGLLNSTEEIVMDFLGKKERELKYI
ncbi:MAG TPA: ATP-binding cassette domain-containing protein [Ignavibacteria bacterium]